MAPAPRAKFNPVLYPPSGWSVRLADGRIATGDSFDSLVAAVAKSLSVTDEEARYFVDERLCASYPSYCQGARPVNYGGMTPADRASILVTEMLSSTPARTSAAMAEARLETCRACPHNAGPATPGCCGGRATLESATAKAAKDLDVKAAFDPGWCGLTGANLRFLSTFLIRPVADGDPLHDSLPPGCPCR